MKIFIHLPEIGKRLHHIPLSTNSVFPSRSLQNILSSFMLGEAYVSCFQAVNLNIFAILVISVGSKNTENCIVSFNTIIDIMRPNQNTSRFSRFPCWLRKTEVHMILKAGKTEAIFVNQLVCSKSCWTCKWDVFWYWLTLQIKQVFGL